MKNFVFSWVSMFALLVLPLGGCSSGTTDGSGGTVGDGGNGGAAGNGGEAGSGGSAGVGGTAGGGGTAVIPAGVWIGAGIGGSAGSVDICFAVNAEGTALTQGADSEQPCELFAVEVMFGDCAAGNFSYKPDIPIVDGSFELLLLGGATEYEVRGRFDGSTAAGEVTTTGDATCSAQWEAVPNESP